MKFELGPIGTLCGIFTFGQVKALLSAPAFAPAGDHDLSRSILNTLRRQSLMTLGQFDPSEAAVAINRSIQAGRKRKSSLDCDMITRATHRHFSFVPMGTNYHDKELDLATAVCEKDHFLLQSPGDRFGMRGAEEAL